MWTPVGPIAPVQAVAQRGDARANEGSLSFKDLLEKAFESANGAQHDAERAAQLLATGQIDDVHQVTILTEKANLSLQLMISIRNKVIDAYQEISRMQV